MTLSKYTKREIIRNLFISSAIFAFGLGYNLMSHNTKGAIIMAVLIAIEQIVVLVVWRCKTKEDELEKKRKALEEIRQWNAAVEKAAAIPPEDLPKYNGGLTHIDWGNGNDELGVKPLRSRLPIPDEGMKWAMRLRDTKGGDILPDLVQVPKDEDISGWKDGYPKYE